MTEHLPECPVEKRLRSGKTVSSQTCICGALRACEDRVLDAAVQRVEALAVNPYYCEDQWYGAETHLVTSQVIAAIEALRGKRWLSSVIDIYDKLSGRTEHRDVSQQELTELALAVQP